MLLCGRRTSILMADWQALGTGGKANEAATIAQLLARVDQFGIKHLSDASMLLREIAVGNKNRTVIVRTVGLGCQIQLEL